MKNPRECDFQQPKRKPANRATETLTHGRCRQSLPPHQLGGAEAIQKVAELAVRGQADPGEDQAGSKMTFGIKPWTPACIQAALVSLRPLIRAGALGTTVSPLTLTGSRQPAPPPWFALLLLQQPMRVTRSARHTGLQASVFVSFSSLSGDTDCDFHQWHSVHSEHLLHNWHYHI